MVKTLRPFPSVSPKEKDLTWGDECDRGLSCSLNGFHWVVQSLSQDKLVYWTEVRVYLYDVNERPTLLP